jgi:hypothetical protein
MTRRSLWRKFQIIADIVSELNRATEARNCFKTYQMSEAEKISLVVIVNNLEDEDTSNCALPAFL